MEYWYSNAAKSSMFYNKVKWQRLGEKNSRYFFGLEKPRYNNLGINAIYNKEKEVIKQPERINEILRDYWGNLYSSKQETLNERILNEYTIDLPQLPEEQKQKLEQAISLEECKEALFSMIDGKVPGEDGLTAAFYKCFWEVIQTKFMEMVNKVYENGAFPESMNMGILRLLPKPNKDLLNDASWRPICLQGVDIKIVAKVLATILKSVLDYVIHEDQVGFRAGKYIGETLQFIMDLMDKVEKEKIGGYILSLDIEKAFDSVEWPYLDKALERFGFGQK